MPASDLEDFFAAVREGDPVTAGELLDRDPSLLEAQDGEGRSPLLLAVYHGHHELVNLLAERRPATDIFEAAASGRAGRVRDLVRDEPGQVSFTSPDGFSPLGLAAFFGHPEIVEILLEAGADPRVRSRNAMSVTPLHSAAATGDPDGAVRACRALLERGADPDAAQAGGWRPLHQAAAHGNVALVRLLLRNGADPGVKSDDGRTPLSMCPPEARDELAPLLEGR